MVQELWSHPFQGVSNGVNRRVLGRVNTPTSFFQVKDHALQVEASLGWWASVFGARMATLRVHGFVSGVPHHRGRTAHHSRVVRFGSPTTLRGFFLTPPRVRPVGPVPVRRCEAEALASQVDGGERALEGDRWRKTVRRENPGQTVIQAAL